VAQAIGAGIIIVGSSAGVSPARNRADAARLIVDEARAADIVVLPAS
jgi:D-alanine-D-alanine ligase-like ATP-grasp enzyme